jgi:hypothetical protein
MKVEQVLPAAAERELSDVLEAPKHDATPFAPELIEFCSALSSALMADAEARAFPELQALAFWMRRSAALRLKEQFDSIRSTNCLLAPRGIVFHIPPTNVDTIFLYSWTLAFLTGNRNIIRLSSNESRQSAIMIRLFRSVLDQPLADQVRNNTIVLRYGHDPEITEAISGRVDLRIIWGGDDTIRQIRTARLAPGAKELSFADRDSIAAFNTEAYLKLADVERTALAERFYNDAYWFDQMACSSPHLIVWCGGASQSEAASRDFYGRLRNKIIEKGYALSTGAYLRKLAFAYGAILDTPSRNYDRYGNELTILTMNTLRDWRGRHPGGGFFYQVYMHTLDELIEFVERRDQTLSVFGFAQGHLEAFARRLNGRGIDRIVPTGSALTFQRFWDGYDLLQELTRRVYLSSGDDLMVPGITGVSTRL